MEQLKTPEEVLNFARMIHWLGHASVKINYQDHVIYIDPFRLSSSDNADMILVTHDHHDHLSIPDIAKIATKKTRFVVAAACVEKLEQAGYMNIQPVLPESKISILGLTINAVPAYNLTKPMHPPNRSYVGYLIDFDGIKVYHTGDTERIPEMKDIRCDIMLVPLGQTYTMNSVEEAAGAVLDTKASIAIPIHWGLFEGTGKDEKQFSQLLEHNNIRVLTGR